MRANRTQAELTLAAADLPDHLKGWSDSNTLILVGDHWEVLRPGVNCGLPNQPGSWNYIVEISYRYRLEHPGETIRWVQEVKGSAPLADDAARLDWSPRSGELYANLTAKLATAKALLTASGESTHVDAIFWMQGEQDATHAKQAAAYQAHLSEEFALFRKLAGDLHTTIIFGRIADDYGQPHAEDVREAQAAVDAADPHAVMIDTDDFSMQPDNLHYDAEGQVALGDAFFEQLPPDIGTGSPAT